MFDHDVRCENIVKKNMDINMRLHYDAGSMTHLSTCKEIYDDDFSGHLRHML